MKQKQFTQRDHDKLEKAKQLLLDVLNDHYGDPEMDRRMKRLETIIIKLEVLQNLD